MDFIYCGIKFPAPRNYEKVRVEIDFNENSGALKEKIQKEILSTKDEISLVFCGNELNDDEPINKYNLRAGSSTIQVLRKTPEVQTKEFTTKFNEIDVGRVCSLFRGLNSGNFHKISRPEVIQQIFKKHPELQRDVIALSFLKDPILLSNLQNPETVRNMAENHRILVEAADTICKALRSVKSSNVELQQPVRPMSFEDLSDSSSSSENIPQASTSNAANIRITQDYLRRSLEQARQNQNSLANISQRNLSQADGSGSNSISPSSSSSSVPNRRNIISNSMVMSAIHEVLRARRSESDVYGREQSVSSNASSVPENQSQETPQEPENESERMEEDDTSERDARDIEMITSFQAQLRQMEDMGLTNKAANIQALMVCNGNLEAAVNLVLAEMNMI